MVAARDTTPVRVGVVVFRVVTERGEFVVFTVLRDTVFVCGAEIWTALRDVVVWVLTC